MATTIGRAASNMIKIAYDRAGLYEPTVIKLACDYLNKGGVIALPTDTIYGLAAKVSDVNALEKIYKIKGRNKSKPLAICLANVSEIEDVAEVGHLNKRVLVSILPGPVTVLLKRNSNLSTHFNPDIETVGIRVPDYDFTRLVCQETGPLALTSANRSGDTSPLEVKDFEDLWPELDCVFNTGLLQNLTPEQVSKSGRSGSTVVDLTEENYFKIVREGCALNRTMRLLERLGLRNKR